MHDDADQSASYEGSCAIAISYNTKRVKARDQRLGRNQSTSKRSSNLTEACKTYNFDKDGQPLQEAYALSVPFVHPDKA